MSEFIFSQNACAKIILNEQELVNFRIFQLCSRVYSIFFHECEFIFYSKKIIINKSSQLPDTSFLYKLLERTPKDFSKIISQTINFNSKTTSMYFTYKDIGEVIEQLVSNSFVHKYTQKIKYNKVTLEQVATILNNTVSKKKRNNIFSRL